MHTESLEPVYREYKQLAPIRKVYSSSVDVYFGLRTLKLLTVLSQQQQPSKVLSHFCVVSL